MKLLLICTLLYVTILDTRAQHASSPENLLQLEYKVFSNGDVALKNQFLFSKYVNYKSQNNFADALKTLYRMDEVSMSDSLKFAYLYEYALITYLNNNFAESDLALQKLFSFFKDDQRLKSVLQLAVLVNNENGNWIQAKEYFKQFLSSKNLNYNVDSLYEIVGKFRAKSIKTASNLSTFAPGSGQFYAGERIHGVLNASLILTGLSWGTYNLLNGYYATALFSGFFVGYMFYEGGMGYAETAVLRYNERFYSDFKSNVKNIILEMP
jgi:tetratricopeptide (TPR) repeat protein